MSLSDTARSWDVVVHKVFSKGGDDTNSSLVSILGRLISDG